jgi:hypothetical protein
MLATGGEADHDFSEKQEYFGRLSQLPAGANRGREGSV